MKRSELSIIGEKLGINCGGKGGKPGPCAYTNSKHISSTDEANGKEIAKSLGGKYLKTTGGGDFQKIRHIEHDDPKQAVKDLQYNYKEKTGGYRETSSGSTSMGHRNVQSIAVAKNPTFKGTLGSVTPGTTVHRIFIHQTGNHGTKFLKD